MYEIECAICGIKVKTNHPARQRYCSECAKQVRKENERFAAQKLKVKQEMAQLKKPQRSIHQMNEYGDIHNLSYGYAVADVEIIKRKRR